MKHVCLTDAAKRYKVVTQMGNQGASGDGVRQLMEWYDAGQSVMFILFMYGRTGQCGRKVFPGQEQKLKFLKL